MAESTHNESEATHPIVDAGQSEASIARVDEDLMASSVKATAVVLGAGASSVEPLPCILSDDSSELEGNAAGAGSASASTSEESASAKVGRSTKAKFDERSSLVLPQGPEAVPTSPHAMGNGALGFIVETLHLGKPIASAFSILLVSFLL